MPDEKETIVQSMVRTAKGIFVPLTGNVKIDLESFELNDGDFLVIRCENPPTREMVTSIQQALELTQKKIHTVIMPTAISMVKMDAEDLRKMGLMKIPVEAVSASQPHKEFCPGGHGDGEKCNPGTPPQFKCQHGKGSTDYCLPCGRVNNA